MHQPIENLFFHGMGGKEWFWLVDSLMHYALCKILCCDLKCVNEKQLLIKGEGEEIVFWWQHCSHTSRCVLECCIQKLYDNKKFRNYWISLEWFDVYLTSSSHCGIYTYYSCMCVSHVSILKRIEFRHAFVFPSDYFDNVSQLTYYILF